MRKHWTERSLKDYLFRITSDFIAQLENRMELLPLSQDELADRLVLSKGRVSQVLNNPGNMTLVNIIKFARSLGMKVSIVAYDDGDLENKKGPVNAEVFKVCWEQSGKPHDFWSLNDFKNQETAGNRMASTIYFTKPGEVYFWPDISQSGSNESLRNIPRYQILKTVAPLPHEIKEQKQLIVNQ